MACAAPREADIHGHPASTARAWGAARPSPCDAVFGPRATAPLPAQEEVYGLTALRFPHIEQMRCYSHRQAYVRT